MANRTLVEAVNDALMVALDGDERVMIMGEDVGRNGGVFRATDGLIDRFGPDRVVDTPLSEAGIIGTAIGLATYGMRPIAEIQFLGFSYQAFAQLLVQAARMRWRSNGRFNCPLVVRAPFGVGVRAPEVHSDALEAHFAHTPGLKVVAPATPYDAKGLLLAAIEDPDPVIVMEPLRGYRAGRAEVPEGHYTVPIGPANVAREGSDVTIVAWSHMVTVSLAAADMLAAEGIAAEVIDLRTLAPFDAETIVRSVQKTGRAVVVHEAPRTSGLGAEIVATINDQALLSLEAPVARVTGYDVPIPTAMIEDYYLPTPARILEAVRDTLSF
ncbi:MAG TPA: alpha-ketoacid dehydrogenase subunit beta [Chloroflexota bacterium]|nr:alpha-ketoacid dehydrogenase subunit beta [Chloroflexota bacterium]